MLKVNYRMTKEVIYDVDITLIPRANIGSHHEIKLKYEHK